MAYTATLAQMLDRMKWKFLEARMVNEWNQLKTFANATAAGAPSTHGDEDNVTYSEPDFAWRAGAADEGNYREASDPAYPGRNHGFIS